MSNSLQQLLDIITLNVNAIQDHFKTTGVDYPSIDAPFNPVSAGENAALSPNVIQSSLLVIAAADQLCATLRVPAMSLFNAIGGFHLSSAIRTLVETNVVEILREAGPKGLHCQEIGKQNGLHPAKLGRLLRLCASHHIFKEVTPDVFANNRLSSMMDTLKSSKAVSQNAVEKHIGTPGVAALIEHSGDVVMKGSAIMTDVLVDKNKGLSDDFVDSPFNVAYKTDKTFWDWLEENGNEQHLNRFSSAMAGAAAVDPPNAVLMGFDWGALPEDSLVVDVGGGIGSVTLKIAQVSAEKSQNVKFVVQDRPSLLPQAKQFWETNMPDALKNGMVKLETHDFFLPQPKRAVAVYLLRMILHDYGRTSALKILRSLRTSASENTKLIIIDQIVPYAVESSGIGDDIPGSQQPSPPAPLLANLGNANAIAYLGDLQMLVGHNGEERTLGAFIDLFKETGWALKRVYFIPGSMHKQLLAVPE